jgi:hypothetical protein
MKYVKDYFSLFKHQRKKKAQQGTRLPSALERDIKIKSRKE